MTDPPNTKPEDDRTMKKEYIILVIVIIASVLYLALRKSDRTHYELPEFAEFSSKQISKIEVASPDGTLDLFKQDDQWVVGEKAYPADKNKMGDILSILKALKVTALVSQSANYVRYDLSPDKKITVKAWAGSQLERELDIGKVANTFGHTFVKLPGDKSVYHAEGNIRRKFDISLDDIRDKQVLIFDENEMAEVLVQAGDQTLALIKKEMTEEPSISTPEEDTGTATVFWQAPDGEKIDKDVVDRLLSTLSDLKCSGYLEDSKKGDLKNPTHSVTLKGEGKKYTISLFEELGTEENKIPGLSSMNDSLFYFQTWKAKDITDAIQDLLPKTGKTE
jgi:hypothetical protein